jgi:23S rRNA pseudouridine1911/1915/1917 synthase
MPNQRFIVDYLKTRLDKFLAEQLPELSRSKIQRAIEAGAVLVNAEKVIESKFVVRKDDKIDYQQIVEVEEEIVPTTPLKILYNNHGLLIIDKPAGLAVHPGAGFKGETLAAALLYEFKDIHLVGEEGRSGIVHRLDKDTSGVMLAARTQEMYEYLKESFSERKVKKEYIALVSGRLENQHGMIDTPIGKSKTDFRKYTTKNMIEAKPSLTEYRVLERLPNEGTPRQKRGVPSGKAVDDTTLVVVKLHTGRTHQIRVHFASLGHPLMGDMLYGNKKTKLPNLSRQFLHAKRIAVQIPNGDWVEAESPLADDLRNVLKDLGSKSLNQL